MFSHTKLLHTHPVEAEGFGVLPLLAEFGVVGKVATDRLEAVVTTGSGKVKARHGKAMERR